MSLLHHRLHMERNRLLKAEAVAGSRIEARVNKMYLLT
jgi:hypothetical protein